MCTFVCLQILEFDSLGTGSSRFLRILKFNKSKCREEDNSNEKLNF